MTNEKIYYECEEVLRTICDKSAKDQVDRYTNLINREKEFYEKLRKVKDDCEKKSSTILYK